MNIFRLTGDLSHLAAIVILLLKIWKTRSCAGERRARPRQGSGAGPGAPQAPPTSAAPRPRGPTPAGHAPSAGQAGGRPRALRDPPGEREALWPGRAAWCRAPLRARSAPELEPEPSGRRRRHPDRARPCSAWKVRLGGRGGGRRAGASLAPG